MPTPIKLCCKGGSEANTGGTGCRTERGKKNLSYDNKSTQTAEIRRISPAGICIIVLVMQTFLL